MSSTAKSNCAFFNATEQSFSLKAPVQASSISTPITDKTAANKRTIILVFQRRSFGTCNARFCRSAPISSLTTDVAAREHLTISLGLGLISSNEKGNGSGGNKLIFCHSVSLVSVD